MQQQLKVLTAVFYGLVGVVAIALVGSIVTGVRQHHVEQNPPPISIPTPAMPSS